MNRIKGFFKNYCKILVVTLIGIVLVVVASLLMQGTYMKNDVEMTNDRQLVKVYEKSREIIKKYERITGIVDNPQKSDLETLYRLLELEPDDIYDEAYLAKCCDNLSSIDNLIIVDGDRNTVYSTGSLTDIDYKDPYYDGLFSMQEGECAIVCDEDNGTIASISIKSGDHYLITQAEDSNQILNEKTGELWKIAELSVGIDTYSDFAVVDLDDNRVIYTDIPSLVDTTLNIKINERGQAMTDDGVYVVQYYDTDEGLRLLALTPDAIVSDFGLSNVILAGVIFLVVLIILISYIICLRQGELDPRQEYKVGKKYFLHSQTKRFKALAVLLGVVIVVIYAFMSSFLGSKYDLKYLEDESVKCQEAYAGYRGILEKAVQKRNEKMFGLGKISSDFVVKHEDYLSKNGMKKLAEAVDSEYLSVIDAEGQMICTSSPLDNLNILSNPESSIYELGKVLVGKEGVVVWDDYSTGTDLNLIFGVPRRYADGVADGMIALTTKGGLTNSAAARYEATAESLFDNFRFKDGMVAFLVDSYGVVVSDVPIESGAAVINEDTMKSDYCGLIEVGANSYLAKVVYMEEYNQYLYVMTPINWFTKDVVLSAAVLAIIYILIALWMWYDGLGSKYHFERRDNKVKDADDWERTELYWDELSVSTKMSKIISICIYALSVVILVLDILIINGILDGNLTTSILESDWNSSVNGFSIIINLCIICLFYTAIRFADFVIKKVESISDGEGETVCRLLSSLIKYIGALVCVYIVVTNFGVDAAAAIASIGIVGLALTFGAQELVKDMISGMFILFEGNFKVGDMLDVNGDWYWIKSIGVRTTTLEAWGSVKVVNNSQMTGMVNIQNSSACVNCDVWIGLQYDLEEVEEIMREELPALKELFSADVSTPVWKGIQELSASGTLIRLRTYCPPLDQGWVGRTLRREVKRILDSHDITLAYEAYVIHSSVISHEEMKKEMEALKDDIVSEMKAEEKEN